MFLSLFPLPPKQNIMLSEASDLTGENSNKRKKTQNRHGMNISLLVKVGVEVGVVKEELGGGELVEGAMQLLFRKVFLV